MHLLLQLVLLFKFIWPADLSAGLLSSTSYDNLSPVQKKYWLTLLHYHAGESRADGELFFLSSLGKNNPKEEFYATIEAFKKPNAVSGWFNYHPQCVFRERFNFLKQVGALTDILIKTCPEFEAWKQGLNADSISLVFSSSYPNNPSSLFGHTLIRFNQKGKKNDLLDYAVAFSARPEHEDIGLIFALKGMFGGYKGLLEVTKYYTKVHEYNNGESRDLMEYDLNITQDELDRLINHLWEIYQTTYFDYYFADENCSAVLVDILAIPFYLDNINVHRRWYYLPSEMVKMVNSIPLKIKSEHFRPSLKKQLESSLSKLSATELSEVQYLAESTPDRQKLLSHYDKIPILDGVISLLNFTNYRTKNDLTNDQKMMMRKSLLRRSSLAQDNDHIPVKYNQKNRPELGHEPRKMSFFTRTENNQSVLGIALKQGYHDLMSNDWGYDPFSQFDFFTGSIIYNKYLNRVSYDEMTFVNLISLHPYQFYDPQFSWAANLSADRIYDLDCHLCHRLTARAYLGPSMKPTPSMVLSLMSGIFGEASKYYQQGVRGGVGIEGSFFWQISDSAKVGFLDELRFDAFHKIVKDYYHRTSFNQVYFPSINNEWRFESSIVSKFRSLKSNTWINQLNYGFYF